MPTRARGSAGGDGGRVRPAAGRFGRFGRLALPRRLALLALLALPAACSSPNPTLYVLAPVPGATHGGAPRVVVLRAIAIAHYLERSQIVHSSEGYRMDVLANEWWGEPLDTMLSRILVQEVNQRLPGTTVYGDSGAISTPSDAAVEINLQRFDLNRDGEVLLVAQIAVDGKRTVSRGVTFTVRPADGTTQALVAAMSTATAQLADAVAGMLASRG
ncbi:MAG: uncharacterized protein QOH05_4611 [Acetobacteraceae bacterium]|jgi:uncharacterized lipoprotein YmbA|nr:uncharacterized protein [Acetobacteraceae bacterium]